MDFKSSLLRLTNELNLNKKLFVVNGRPFIEREKEKE